MLDIHIKTVETIIVNKGNCQNIRCIDCPLLSTSCNCSCRDEVLQRCKELLTKEK